MNLICFPHYTCGGVLCDIFQESFSPISFNGGIGSFYHNLGKIGDSDGIFNEFDSEEFYNQLYKVNDDSAWVGTHCHPGNLDSSKFKKILNVTTTTFKSKIYRWARAYYHYYYNSEPWLAVSGLDRVDKERETAKNYLQSSLPVLGTNIINFEFSELVELTQGFKNLVTPYDYESSINRWRRVNKFLYEKDFWETTPVTRFYEAELEANLSTSYEYK